MDPWWVRAWSHGTSVVGLSGAIVGPLLFQRGSMMGAWCFRSWSVGFNVGFMVIPRCVRGVATMSPR